MRVATREVCPHPITMKKQQIILIIVVVIIFAGFIYLGVKQTPKSQPIVNNQPFENVLPGENGEPFVPIAQDAAKPSQSGPLEQLELPKSAIRISITEQGIAPTSFEVKSGEEVMLGISSADQWTHIFKFKSEKLIDVAVGVGPKETRAISFITPKEKGEYEFYCDVPGHTERGEKGAMIVK